MSSSILSDLIITNIISATTIYTDKGAKVRRSCRNAWAFALKYEGETEYISENIHFTSNANELVLLPKGSDYEWTCRESGHCIIVDFECASSHRDIYSFHISNPDKILRRMRELEYKLTLRAPLYRQDCIKNIYEIILSVANEKAQPYIPSDKADKLAPAIDYIAKNYARSITNDDLAVICGLSTVYFRKLFREVFGTSPINYVHKLRIIKAKEMLASDFASISAIALSLGYANIYDFSRVFKKYTGVPPSRY